MIKIIADTTSLISPSEAKYLGIALLPQMIIFGDQVYRDDYEITSSEFLIKLKSSSNLPKTAAPSPSLYAPLYEEFHQQGHTILVLCPSVKVSGTFGNASVAAKEFTSTHPDANIFIVDTEVLGPALGTLIRKAIEWAENGVPIEVIQDRVKELGKKVRIYLYVDTLEYLYRGGRIGAAKTVMGSILQVKPILVFMDGQVHPFEMQRTKKKAIKRIFEIVTQECPSSPEANLTLLEADSMEDVISLRDDFQNYYLNTKINIVDLPPAIIVHAGPGVLAVSFFKS